MTRMLMHEVGGCFRTDMTGVLTHEVCVCFRTDMTRLLMHEVCGCFRTDMTRLLSVCVWVFQDSLKKRMEQLKQSILEGSKAVEEEKAKNIELLHEIFPPTIATKLWRGD